jgi:hypothetical protein
MIIMTQIKVERAVSSTYKPLIEEKEETNEDVAKLEITQSQSFAPLD